MSHLFKNRPQQHNLLSEKSAGYDVHFNWKSVKAILDLLGGATFIVGSILFLPKYENFANAGPLTFFGGSLIYLIVTGHDLIESIGYLRSKRKITIWNWLEFLASNLYVIGTILFTVGSILFLPWVDLIIAGSWCFIIGSLLFLIGACINLMQIIQTDSLITLQLMNATAISFGLGAILFVVASMPYLWQISSPEYRQLLLTYVAWEYIVGSLLFFISGVFNYYRLYLTMQFDRQATQQSFGKLNFTGTKTHRSLLKSRYIQRH